MKFILLLTAFLSAVVGAETITIKSPYNANHAGHSVFYKMVDYANQTQSKYTFVLELKPGGQGVVALRSMDQTPTNSLAIINASFVQNTIRGEVHENDYVPVTSIGDACWFVVSKVGDEKAGIKSLQSTTDRLVFGVVGVGSAGHLLSLSIADKLQRPVETIPFKSQGEANMLLVGDNTLNIGMLSRVEYNNLKAHNQNLKRLAVHCDHRHPDARDVATTKEQGINSPYVFNTVVASKYMSYQTRTETAAILDRAILHIGREQIMELSEFNPPIFSGKPVDVYHQERIAIMKRALKKYQTEIDKASK